MKGYAGGLVSFRRTDFLHIRPLERDLDDMGVSFTVCWVLVLFWGLEHDERMTFIFGLSGPEDVQRFAVKNGGSGTWRCSSGTMFLVLSFQLESLILAQNERWREA